MLEACTHASCWSSCLEMYVPRDGFVDEMGAELGGSFQALTLGGAPNAPGRNGRNGRADTSTETPKEPKTKKAKTAAQEAQTVTWHACRLHTCLSCTQANNTANRYLTDSQILLNELSVATEQTVSLGIASFVHTKACAAFRSAHFKTALVSDLKNSISEVTDAKDKLVAKMASKSEVKESCHATSAQLCLHARRWQELEMQLKRHKKTMDTVKNHLKPPSEGKAKGSRKAKAKPKAAA